MAKSSKLKNRVKPVKFDDDVNDFFEIFKLPFFVLRIFGIFPFTFVYQGNQIVLKTYTTETKMALVLYLAGAIFCARRLAYELSSFEDENNRHFDFWTSMIPLISMRCYLLMLPLLFWRKKECLQALINDWLKFQTKFKSVTQLTFVPVVPMKKKVFWIYTSALALNALIRGLFQYSLRRSIEASIIILHISSIQTCVLMYWCLGALFHGAIAKSFYHAIEFSVIKFNHLEVSRLTELWIDLSSLLDNFYDVHSSLFAYQLGILILDAMISFYHAIVVLIPQFKSTDNFNDQLYHALYLVITGSWFLGTYLYIENGYQVEKKINFDLKEKVLLRDVTRLDVKLLHELWNFLRVIEVKNPAIYLRKTWKMNRKFLTMIFGIVIEFLIILRQFGFVLGIYNNDDAERSHIQINHKTRKWIPEDWF